MIAKYEMVTIEEAKGNVSTKDASKYYGSVVLKQRDEATKKKTSIEIPVNNALMVQTLEQYEMDETVCNVKVAQTQTKFGLQFGEILEIEIVR